MLADHLPVWRTRTAQPATPFLPGLSVIIPERDAPRLLACALQSVDAGLGGWSEPSQIIVVVNGAPRERYADVAGAHRGAEFVYHVQPLGFSSAIMAGLARARYDWTLLLNNDMTLDAAAIRELAACRAEDVFAIGAQIMQQSADGRREETGLTDWYADATGVRIFHAAPGDRAEPGPNLCASGGAALFRTDVLRRYVREGADYDPCYWEDVEWSVRARQDSLRVLFCPAARAHHRHRATTGRFFAPAELDRIVERNRLLCDLRNGLTRRDGAWSMQRVCDQPYASQRELSALSLVARLFARRRMALRPRPPVVPQSLPAAGAPALTLAASPSVRFKSASRRPRVLVVSPFCVYPPRHGGARRLEGLLGRLRADFDVALLCDEASLHDVRSFACFDGLLGVTLVQRPHDRARIYGGDLAQRMRAHCHDALMKGLREAIFYHQPHLVQVEHVELAMLSATRTADQRWVLGLHDAFADSDFVDASEASRLAHHVRATYDAVTVCSAEDQRMLAHPHTVCVPNGMPFPGTDPAPSYSTQLLFMGPFRYRQNLEGIRHFLQVAYPAIKSAVPDAALVVLGGDGASAKTAGDRAFTQPDVSVLEHRDDVRALLEASALTVNPLSDIRGSAVKVIESLGAGRACVSTLDGARGFLDAGLEALVTVDDIPAMVDPIVGLLRDPVRRRCIERPDMARLAAFSWDRCASIQSGLYHHLIGR